MDDKNFKKMDEAWMKKMQPLRDKEVSEGMLKGFSASVERRIEAPVKRSPAYRRGLVPLMTVLVLASLVTLHSDDKGPLQLAQEEALEEIDILKELGVWSEAEDETVIGAEDILADIA